MAREDGMGGNNPKQETMTPSEMEFALQKLMARQNPSIADRMQSFLGTPPLSDGTLDGTEKPLPGNIIVKDFPEAREYDISIPSKEFNPDNNRNTGYGPKGNIFPGSAAERSALDSIYGGTGSANALARAAEGETNVSNLGRLRLKEEKRKRLLGLDKPEQKVYRTFGEFIGK
jgi:hypothetical protein